MKRNLNGLRGVNLLCSPSLGDIRSSPALQYHGTYLPPRTPLKIPIYPPRAYTVSEATVELTLHRQLTLAIDIQAKTRSFLLLTSCMSTFVLSNNSENSEMTMADSIQRPAHIHIFSAMLVHLCRFHSSLSSLFYIYLRHLIIRLGPSEQRPHYVFFIRGRYHSRFWC